MESNVRDIPRTDPRVDGKELCVRDPYKIICLLYSSHNINHMARLYYFLQYRAYSVAINLLLVLAKRILVANYDTTNCVPVFNMGMGNIENHIYN